MPKHARYTGEGYVFGVPSHDMTKSEWDALPKERRNIALKAGTHKILSASKKKEEKPIEEVTNG